MTTLNTTDSATPAGLKELTDLFAFARRLDAIRDEASAPADQISETRDALALRLGIDVRDLESDR
jgi:phytoene/squalene synthetase